MKGKKKSYRHVEELHVAYQQQQHAIRQRLAEFVAVSDNEYFYELVYCLLTPQSSAVNAAKAVEALEAADFLHRDIDVAALLFRKEHYIRFHNTKGRRLKELRERFAEVQARLSKGSAGPDLRAWLVKNVNGAGWKEASHFLRNIGHHDLAILDRHILKNLRRHAVIRAVPKTLTPKRYLAIEKKFNRFARDIGVSMDELDLLFWSRETGRILK